MASPYIFDPLQENQLRLLRVTQDDSAPHGIVLDLRHVALGAAQYVALSYTWGRPEPLDMDPSFDENKTYQLRCGDGFLSVRQNLFDFLQQTKTLGHPAPLLWIDALCINQEDLDERSRQVVLMSKIYTCAKQVWIWLGARDPSEGAHRILDEFIPAIIRNYDGILGKLSSHALWSSHERVIEKAIGSDALSIWSSSWREYIDLIQRRWFNRAWTIQEVIRTDLRAILVFAGTRKYPWMRVYLFQRFLMICSWFLLMENHLDSNAQRAFTCASSRLVLFEKTRRTNAPNGRKSPEQQWYESLLQTVTVARRHAMSDERDVIYACLGMMIQIAPEGMESAVVPDYNLSIEETYVKFTNVLLRKMFQLQVLSLVGNQEERNHKNMPSWAPDYSISPPGAGALLANNKRCRRTDRLNVSVVPRINGDRLHLHGACVTTVKDKAARYETTDFLTYVLDICRESRQYPGTMQPMREAVWNTMAWDELPPEKEDQENVFQQWLLWRYDNTVSEEGVETERGAEICKSLRTACNDLYPGVLDKDRADHGNEFFSKYIFGFFCMMNQRCLYTATDGRIGAGPKWLQPEDEVWIFENGHVPFILRRNADGETYRLIGETYMHGVMRGEAMTDDFISEFGPVVLI